MFVLILVIIELAELIFKNYFSIEALLFLSIMEAKKLDCNVRNIA